MPWELYFRITNRGWRRVGLINREGEGGVGGALGCSANVALTALDKDTMVSVFM
jgi:hypothetical protein